MYPAAFGLRIDWGEIMSNYQIIQLGAFAFVAEDVRTGNRSATVRSEQEARILIATLAIRNLMHS